MILFFLLKLIARSFQSEIMKLMLQQDCVSKWLKWMKLLFSDEQVIAVYFIKFSFMFKAVHFKIGSFWFSW